MSTFTRPPATRLPRPDCIHGCTADHSSDDASPSEWEYRAGWNCVRHVYDMTVQVTRTAVVDEDVLRIGKTQVYWYVPAHDHEQDMTSCRARQLLAELVSAVEQAAQIADELNAEATT